MKGNQDQMAGDQQRCQIAGDVIERALPEAQPKLDAAQRDRLREALASRRYEPGQGRRRRVLIAGLTLLTTVGGAAALVLLRPRPITFAVQGGGRGQASVGVGADDIVAGDGRVETPAGQSAALRFSDGSRVTLAGASAGRVVERTADGATVAIDHGRARFDVVHRVRTRWVVSAGPFEVLVTGTSFDLDWSGARARTLAVDLHSGSVTVRGGLAGTGVLLRAGQRLVADVDRGRVTIGDRAQVRDGAPRSGAASAIDTADPAPTGEASPPLAEATEPAEAPGAADGGRSERGRAARATFAPAGRNGGIAAPAAGLVDLVDRPRGQAAPFARPGPGLPGPSAVAVAGVIFPPAPPSPPSTEPAPWPAPLAAADVKLAAGGAACLGWSPQVRFDRVDRVDHQLDGIEVGSAMSLAFTRPVIDHARTWCGAGSLRVDARFDLAGAPNRLGHPARHAGEVLVDLREPIDLTGKTVTVHFFVEGPSDVRFAAQLFAIDRPTSGDPRWVGGGVSTGLTTGRWWTITHAFERENRLFEGGTSPVDRVGRVSLQIYAIGKDRVWTGRVFVDDIGWQ